MAEHNCPKCKQNTFTWSVDEDVSPFTKWRCSGCGYQAQEDEQKETVCPHCKERSLSYLSDENKTYTWCYHCHQVQQTNIPEHLQSTVQLIQTVFPAGLEIADYIQTIAVFYGHLSDRNLSEVLSYCTTKTADEVYADIPKYYKITVQPDMQLKFNTAGFIKWLDEQ